MRINKNQNTNSKKVKIIVAALLALFVLGGVGYALSSPESPFYIGQKNEDNPENTVNYNEPLDEQKKTGENIKEQFNKDKYPDGDIDNTTPASDLSVSISSVQSAGDVFSIRTIINGADSAGMCILTMTLGDKVISREAETQLAGSYYICKGFDVSKSELQTGEWGFVVKYIDTSGSSESLLQKVRID